jgi:carbon monoxide dehydrogenase subunit G
VEATDQRVSGLVQGTLTMKLDGLSAGETTLTVSTDVNLFGKIGEFGGPIIKKKADEMMKDFASNVGQAAMA